MPTTYNPKIDQNVDWVFQVTAKSNNVAIDLTGYTIELQVRDNVTNAELLSLTIGSGLTVTTPSNGIVLVRATAAQMLALNAGQFPFGMVAQSGSGVITSWIEGVLTVGRVRVQ